MRGVGGPLLCIGDLLTDVGDDKSVINKSREEEESGIESIGDDSFNPSDLNQLFQDNYNKLIKSLEGDDHSWTSLTLKLCDALKKANKLVTSANSNVESLLVKVEELENILKRGDSAIETLKAIQFANIKNLGRKKKLFTSFGNDVQLLHNHSTACC